MNRDGLPKIGDRVRVDDPLGYSGEGVVRDVQRVPHQAVLVKMETITDRSDQSMVGRATWILAGHVTVI